MCTHASTYTYKSTSHVHVVHACACDHASIMHVSRLVPINASTEHKCYVLHSKHRNETTQGVLVRTENNTKTINMYIVHVTSCVQVVSEACPPKVHVHVHNM